ncbi:MAG: dihydrofolate reductase [Bacteroidetes bacterium]|nr:MAG: dihydrofolate reductase [Bacteroidota bacterium]PTM14665.1 MAG: dihydrofolate reductase [Bacteroidota bacterium]
MATPRKVILYIATSLDGYIAQPNDDLAFLDIVAREGEDYGYFGFVETVDTMIMGRRTYDWVLQQVPELPHPDLQNIIITRTARPGVANTSFYAGPLPELIANLKKKPGKHIFCNGGAEVVNELLRHQLIDELIISVVPILVGNGIKLFQDGRPVQRLHCLGAKTFASGLVQLHYTTTV